MSREWVERADFVSLFDDIRQSSWRWECQGEYLEPNEEEPFRLWRESRPDDSWMRPWMETVSRWWREGKTFERVRMLTDPLTDYLRWMLDITHLNVEAGEDIRWIDEESAQRLRLPRYDYYVFDEDRVVIMHFDDHGVSGAELIDEPSVVHRHLRWRDAVWPEATPHREYMAERSP